MTHSYVCDVTHIYIYKSPILLHNSPIFPQTIALFPQQDPSISTLYILLPIADKVAQNLEIFCKNFQFSTKSARILMGCII